MRPTSGELQPPIPRKYAIPAFFVLVAAGLAGNAYPYEVFFNIQFVCGGIFAMLALQLLGLGPGVLAAVIVSTATWPLWNHPTPSRPCPARCLSRAGRTGAGG